MPPYQQIMAPLSEVREKEDNMKGLLQDTLTHSILDLFKEFSQCEKTLISKLRLRDIIYHHLGRHFPFCGIYVVGSTLNGFASNTNSDVDLCLVVAPHEIDQHTQLDLLKKIQHILSFAPEVREQNLIHAKVPILRMKFNGAYEDLVVDLNVNNVVAVRNTHLLCYYAFYDWRVRPLVMAVKRWAKESGINDSTRSTFTSYSLVLMTLHYLQISKIIPSLQYLFPKRFDPHIDIRTLNLSIPLERNFSFPGNLMERNETSLGELLIGFFRYYANFDFDTYAISVRLGRLAARSEMQNGLQWALIFVEEPFTHHNTAHSVFDVIVFQSIRAKFRQAHEVLLQTSDVSELLKACSPSTMPVMNTPAALSPVMNAPDALPAMNSSNTP